MGNLLSGLLWPAILGAGLLISWHSKKKRASKLPPAIEYKVNVRNSVSDAGKQGGERKHPPLLIRIPKLVDD